MSKKQFSSTDVLLIPIDSLGTSTGGVRDDGVGWCAGMAGEFKSCNNCVDKWLLGGEIFVEWLVRCFFVGGSILFCSFSSSSSRLMTSALRFCGMLVQKQEFEKCKNIHYNVGLYRLLGVDSSEAGSDASAKDLFFLFGVAADASNRATKLLITIPCGLSETCGTNLS